MDCDRYGYGFGYICCIVLAMARSGIRVRNRFLSCLVMLNGGMPFLPRIILRGEEIPPLHNSRCLCARRGYDWVLSVVGQEGMAAWIEAVCAELGVERQEWQERLEQRLFGVTRRSLADDLRLLVELGLLARQGHKFAPLKELPQWVREPVVAKPVRGQESPTKPPLLGRPEVLFGNLDFGSLAQRYGKPVGGGVQRFLVHVDYVVCKGQIDRVEDWQEAFYQLWQQSPVPPVRLLYRSSRMRVSRFCVVYPVCCYYVRRSIYLCGFGQTPTRQGRWYNFRLDHIEDLEPLSWESEELPFFSPSTLSGTASADAG